MTARQTIPRAAYRLQFHPGFTLKDALPWVPYLSTLGVSHVYASPLLKASPGSKHGYDVTDPTHINDEIGTEADLSAFVSSLREHNMGLVLDIVPNHMGIGGPENRYWWDVLKHGRNSQFADYFDIDWNSPIPNLRDKVLLPVLGDEYDKILESGKLKVVCENSEVTIRYFDHRFPVSPESVLLPASLLEETLVVLNSNPKALASFIEKQHYRLAFWRQGDTMLNYRRFFTITDLAGICVERPDVFENTHSHIIAWYRQGLLDGLRVDHPDGLRDPLGYLQRLHAAMPNAWIVVEKILEPGEQLPGEWPVAGTTGYDYLNHLTKLMIDPAGEKPLTEFYADFTGEPTDCEALLRDKKRWILNHNLLAEVNRLVCLLLKLSEGDHPFEGFTEDQMRDSLIELIACFSVYRTYIQPDPTNSDGRSPSESTDSPVPPAASSPFLFVREEDARIIASAVALAGQQRAEMIPLFDRLKDLLLLRFRQSESAEFAMRFQQLTGPAMAKGMEDTSFYCFNRYIVLNEVGGDPSHFGMSVRDFHHACTQATRNWPGSMLATSTHDTKRSEDVRARLALLSEIPDRWTATVRRWSALNEQHRRNNWPDRNAEYFFYQTLAGAWPLPLDRALACMEKAVREAKQHTDWTNPNKDYESALSGFVTSVLNDREFINDAEQFIKPLVRPGRINSLAQSLLKLTTPGVPDIYQGTEFWDLSLMDPDNRRTVDFAQRNNALNAICDRISAAAISSLLPDLLDNLDNGHLKLFIIHRALQFRQQHELLFRNGDYVPLAVTGSKSDYICAFARTHENSTAVTVVPRWILGLTGGQDRLPVGEEVWGDTRFLLPDNLAGNTFHNAFTGEIHALGHEGASDFLRIADALNRFPVALMENLEPTDSTPATA